MKLLWTKSKSPLGFLIRWIFDEPVSHFAIQFDHIVFHSNLLGVHIQWKDKFLKSSQVVFERDIYLTLEDEEKIYQNIQKHYDGKTWDFLGGIYLGLEGLKYKLFGLPMDLDNPWGGKHAYMCQELAKVIPPHIAPKIHEIDDLEMITPYQLYLIVGGKDVASK